jgi:hypothetical protein
MRYSDFVSPFHESIATSILNKLLKPDRLLFGAPWLQDCSAYLAKASVAITLHPDSHWQMRTPLSSGKPIIFKHDSMDASTIPV